MYHHKMMGFNKVRFIIASFLVSSFFLRVDCRTDWRIEKNASFWNEMASIEIQKQLEQTLNTGVAKNVLLFLGDGMGMTTVTAGRIRKGQIQNELGEDFQTEMEQLPYTGFSKTYSIDYQTSDSAATATAYLCGIKNNLGTIGVDGRASRNNCPSSIGAEADSILDWAQKRGKKVGIVTNTRITHATPAAAYAHAAERDWESFDGKKFQAQHVKQGCSDIAFQLMTHDPPIDLILGGGRSSFYPTTTSDVEYPNITGTRIDNKTLIEEYWKGEYVWSLSQMNKIPVGTSKPILGLFEASHMLYETDRQRLAADEPSLSQMTEFAVKHLSSFKEGFFLLVEGGRIDHAHHDNLARYALDEFVEFDNAVGVAKKILNKSGLKEDSLLVVTADHSHVFTMGSYPRRGSNIFAYGSLEGKNVSEIDQSPINILSYGNGLGFNQTRNATILYSIDTNNTSYRSPAALPMRSETHGGEDVPIYSNGPWSHLFSGTLEQHMIAHKMAYAACLGPYETRDGCSLISSSPSVVFDPISVFMRFIITNIFTTSLFVRV